MIPYERRDEVHHLSTKSMRLAGFTLAFLGLIFGFYRDTPSLVMGPSVLLLIAFILLLIVAQFTWSAMKQWQFYTAEVLHKGATVLLVIAGLWIFQIVFPIPSWTLILLGLCYTVYIVTDLFFILNDVKTLWEISNE